MHYSFWRRLRGFVLAVTVACPIAFAANTAVLPFSNRTPVRAAANSSSLDWIGEAIAETIRDAIDSRGGVSIAREDIDQAFRQLGLRPLVPITQASVLKLGEALDADQLVYGSYEFVPDNTAVSRAPLATPANAYPANRGALKISAHVFVHGKSEQSRQFEESGSIDDLATFEAHAAWRTLTLALPNLAPQEAEHRSLSLSPRLDAQESYIRGMLAKDPATRQQLFQQAARLDPRFGHPSWQLGQISYEHAQYRQSIEWLRKVPPQHVRYRDATFLLGLALFQTNDFLGAEAAFQKLAEVIPLGEVFNNLGAAQSRLNLPKAVVSFQKALESDPNDPAYHFNLGYALWRKGDFAAAAERFRSAVERDPDDQVATLLLGYSLKKQGIASAPTLPQTQQRLKLNFDERAYKQLKALLQTSRP